MQTILSARAQFNKLVILDMVNRLLATVLSLLFFGCSTHNHPKIVDKDDLGLLSERETSLIELRVGDRFCQGTLYKPNQVLTTAPCVNSGQGIIVRSLTNPTREMEGKVISSLPDGYALVETPEPLEGNPLNLGRIKPLPKDSLYFFRSENRQWYLIGTQDNLDFSRQGYLPGTAIFNREGYLVGQQIFHSNILSAADIRPFVDDASSGTIREPDVMDDARLTFNLGLILSAIRDEEGRYKANHRFALETNYQVRRWELGVGMYGLGHIIGPGIHSSYRYEWVKTFDSIPFAIEPTIGFLRYPYVGLGLEFGKFAGQLRYYKTDQSDLVEMIWNPLRLIL